ncbi:MAG: GMC family oxidoreductase [Myxococcales bacterium]|nr:GMC family oxidoreductase [Myxococcales bacterium]
MKPLTRDYDAIVVGSGFGGGAAAYALSRRGLHTLMLERGVWPLRDADDWNGRQILLDGRYKANAPVAIAQYGKPPKDTVPNAVVGGNSVFFGGAALRLRPTDFADWAVSYDGLEPFYAEAERLLEVHGQAGADPHEPPRSGPYPAPAAALTPPAARIHAAATAVGFHPFAVPTAIDFSGARGTACLRCSTCDGFPCKVGAKNDVAMTLLAKSDPERLMIVSGVTATRVLVEGKRAVGVEVLDPRTGQRHTVRARVVVAAGGAVQTPALLLRSGLEVMDASGLLGRNLMRHCNAMVGYVFPFATNPEQVNHKQICVSDLYEQERAATGRAVGVIQDMMMPPPDVVRVLAPKGFRFAAHTFAAHIQTLICIAEDEPQAENRVTLSARTDEHGLPITSVDHRYTRADVHRRELLVRAARKILRKAGGFVGKVNLVDSFSHAVGSVRFGSDPATAVLDRECAFFRVPNLFVTDGSVMPTSGGVNPSLTITANALRVSQAIRQRL